MVKNPLSSRNFAFSGLVAVVAGFGTLDTSSALGGRCEMATSNHKSYSEFGSVMRAGLTALCLTTALCTPALACGRGGISVSIGGTVGGVGGAVGSIGGSVGSISSGSGGGLSVGGVTIGTGGGRGTPSFTGSN